MSETESATLDAQPKVRLTEAAHLLEELGIIKAFSPSGKINGPNCYNYGHRDSVSGIWWWYVLELVDIARKRRTASPETIERVLGRFDRVHTVPPPVPKSADASRAEMEKKFRDLFRGLESLLRTTVSGDARETFGQLIGKAERQQLYSYHQLAELSAIKAVRNSLYHSGRGDVDDGALARAIESISAWIRALTTTKTNSRSARMKIGELEFEYVCEIEPDRNEENLVRQVMPHDRDQAALNTPLNKYGTGPFCRFRIPAKLEESGVYALTTGKNVLYLGECVGLSARFNAGYGNISPRNIYKGGRETNCRLNTLIYKAAESGQLISLWFFQTRDYKSVEAALRSELRPPWNRI